MSHFNIKMHQIRFRLGSAPDSGVLLKMEVDIRKGGVAKGLKVPCLFMITEVSIRCQKNPGGWYTPYTRVYPAIHHWPRPRWGSLQRFPDPIAGF